jgi:hypothetical protein
MEAIGSSADDAQLVVQPLGEAIGEPMTDVGEKYDLAVARDRLGPLGGQATRSTSSRLRRRYCSLCGAWRAATRQGT